MFLNESRLQSTWHDARKAIRARSMSLFFSFTIVNDKGLLSAKAAAGTHLPA